MRVIGIDPGTLVCGWGVIDAEGSRMKAVQFGAVRVKDDMTFPERLVHIHRGLAEVIREHRPEAAAVERLFVGKNVKSAMRTGEGRGIAVLTAALEGLPVHEYTPAEVKKAVATTGRAHKTQVQEMVRIILGLEKIPKPQDAADALAIAICHCQRVPLRGKDGTWVS
ncbi:MAG TPA: crossover junction endodeoxyribonuclease RuvC [Planctomycetota bacterium]|nr:crossover junction endodeoxyribonuclease RuvC [Planctomycetota bacterium]